MRGKRFQLAMVKGSKGRCCTFSQIRSVAVYFLSRKVGEGTDVLSGKIKKCCVFGGPSGGIRRYICPCASEREKEGRGVRIGPPPGLYRPPSKRPKRIGGLSQRSRLEGRRETLELGARGHFEFPVCEFFPLPSLHNLAIAISTPH